MTDSVLERSWRQWYKFQYILKCRSSLLALGQPHMQAGQVPELYFLEVLIATALKEICDLINVTQSKPFVRWEIILSRNPSNFLGVFCMQKITSHSPHESPALELTALYTQTERMRRHVQLLMVMMQ